MMTDDENRLTYLMNASCIDGFGHVEKDRYDYATDIAQSNGREEANDYDELEGFKKMIDVAMAGGDK